MANQDSGLIDFLGSGSGSLSAVNGDYTYVDMVGTGSVSLEPEVLVNSGPIDFSGILSSTISTKVSSKQDSGVISFSGVLSATFGGKLYHNAEPVDMLGTLSGSLSTSSVVQCNDLIIDMDLAFIYSDRCSEKGNSMELKRYRGDTYPVTCLLAMNGNKDVTGMTFKMSMQIDSGTIYTVDGTIVNATEGMVTFIPDPLAVVTAGSGVYDIQGNDGTYDYTYEKGVFTLLDDLTV